MISLRSYRPLDEDFIYHSWLASLDRSVRGVNNAIRPIIDSCVKSGHVLVACSEEDSDHILGWIAWGEPEESDKSLLYVFVKKPLRGNGIASNLFHSVFPAQIQPVPTAFWSFWFQRYELKRKWNLKYNALLLPVMLHGLSNGPTEAE